MRESLFAGATLACGASVTIGAAQAYPPAGWIVGGVLGGIWSWLALGGDS